MYKKISISVLLAFIIALCFCVRFVFYDVLYNTARDGIIVEVPINAFNAYGKLIDNEWREYLQTRKPIGVIFFADHLMIKDKAKTIIKEVKDAIGDKVILSVDEEGGRVNRMDWINIKSARDVATMYKGIKIQKDIHSAKLFVKQQYKTMFKEMKDVGLNMTFAPNLDLNKYESLDKNSNEYKYYKQCAKYVKLFYLKKHNKVDKNDLYEADKAELFFAFLEEMGARKLNVLKSNEDYNNAIRMKWKTLNNKDKQKLKEQFQPLIKYANYASVVGDRSYGDDPNLVGEVAEIFVDTANEYGINCVMKHALGHGRVDGDTHIEKQHLNASIRDILYDIQPYQRLSNKVHYIMPSHIVYDAVDDENSAINSKKVLNFIRNYVNKDIIFITDDISMEGADGNIKSPCDIWIIANKPLDEIKKTASLNKLNKKQVDKIFSKMIL